MPSLSEENYLKAIFQLNQEQGIQATTNAIAEVLNTKASSVTAMLKKLQSKQLVAYRAYKTTHLTKKGELIALDIIRKHRLWEYFLHHKLDFDWHEVHEVAEQLEHIKSKKLIDRLANYLDNPKMDPHGDPIPSKEGVFPKTDHILLSSLSAKKSFQLLGVKDHSVAFFELLDSKNIKIGQEGKVIKVNEYDRSVNLKFDSNPAETISNEVAQNLLVKSLP